jgi:rhamnosyl/mannosyltransferase
MSNIADHVVVSTPSYGQRLGRFVDRGKLSVIPWGVDYKQFYSPPEKDSPFTVIFLGQMRPYKGLPVLLEAVRDLDGVRVWVIGDGHSAQEYHELATSLGLADINFWGRLPDNQMIDLMKQAHVIVLPSITRSEAFGIALLEGMAAGLVPVASHLPGVADVVGNEDLPSW